MDTPTLRLRRTKIGQYASHIVPVLIALTAGPGMLKATNVLALYATSSSTTPLALPLTDTLTCSTATGSGAVATVWVKPVAAFANASTVQYLVSLSALAGTGPGNVTVTAVAGTTLNVTTPAIAYTIAIAAVPGAGCSGAGLGATAATFNFKSNVGTTTAPGGTTNTDVGMTVDVTVTSTTSGLTLAAGQGTTLGIGNILNFSCVLSAGVYYPSGPQTVLIGSTAGTAGTPFTLDATGSLPAVWLATPTFAGGGTATASSPVTMTVALPAHSCDSLAVPPGANTAQTFINLESTGFPSIDKQITVNLTVTAASTSPLIVNPSPITVSCAVSGGPTYTPNALQTVSVTSGAVGGTAFTIGTSPAVPAWLHLVGTGGTASTTAVTFTLQAYGTCNTGIGQTTTIHLVNPPYLDAIFAVTLQIVTPSALTANPTTASFSYVKGSGTAGFVDVNISSTLTSPYFSINDSSLPGWLRTDINSGNAPRSVRFSSTTLADTLAPGTYTANVVFSVSGYGDLIVPVNMELTNKAPTLTVQGANPVAVNWIIGSALPNPTITAISTDTPIAYTATTGGTLAPVIAAGEQSGLAYSFGTPINVSFNPQVFAGAQPGNVLTGTVTLTYGSPAATIVVTFQITVVSPGATITSMSPATLPNSLPSYTVALVGTGFVPTGSSQTRVGIVQTPGAAMYFDPAISYTVTNQSNIALSLTAPTGLVLGLDAGGIPFGVPGHVTIGVCNPIGGSPCAIATASQVLYFGSYPIIQAVTSSSSLLQGAAVPPVAPYDMISIFGSNFCPDCATTDVLTGSPGAVNLTYPTSLVHMANTLTVGFQTHSTHALIANAPLLFATNGQINLMVPSAVTIGTATDIVVSYGPTAGSPQVSAAFPVSIVATDPGIFTVGADGQGSGAALDSNFNLISATNPAGMRNAVGSGGVSDTISIYMTGLGIPDSTADNSTAATDNGGHGYLFSHDCVSTATYLNPDVLGAPSFNTATGAGLTSLDGTLIIPSVLNTGLFVPCITTSGTDAVTVQIGGQTADVATVTYAGWVAGTIAGLYQVNVLLPDNTGSVFTTEAGLTLQAITKPVQLPVTITSNGISTQTGVSIWVAPKLLMLGPTHAGVANTLVTTAGTAMENPAVGGYTIANAVSATHGTAPITYAVTSGLLPAGLSIVPTGSYAGQIVGTPAANTGDPGSNSYTVTVTATDSATTPVTGNNTFVVTVGDGLFMTNTASGVPISQTADLSVSTFTSTGGLATYSYFLANGFTAATGIAIGQSSGIVSTSATTPAGTYPLVVTSYDATTPVPIQGTSTVPIVVNLKVVPGTLNAGAVGAASVIYTAPTVTGYAGDTSVTFAVDSATSNLTWATFNPATGALSITTGAGAGTYPVTITATEGGSLPPDATVAGTATISFNMVIN